MFRIKLIFFSIAVFFCISVVSETDYEIVEGIKRSAVCLVERIARHNHINAKFQKVSLEQKNGTTFIKCKLELGTEEYAANSTSWPKSKEKVSRQAYAKTTKYQKPPLGNRTCIVHQPNTKSDISLLEEYAQSIRSHVFYSEKPRHQNSSFECDATLNDKSGSGIGHTKQLAKTAAATQLLNVIGRADVIRALTMKYNQPQYHNMEPTKRLRKIIRVTELNGDGVYTEMKEKAGKPIVAEVRTSDAVTRGSGSTFEEARSEAAANLLRNMHFDVTYTYNQDTHSE